MFSISNHQPHPENQYAEVFVFLDKEVGRDFCSELTEKDIPFEAEEEGKRLLVGVRRPHIQEAITINNNLLLGRKEPFISNRFFRWAILGLVACGVVLGILGYLFS